MNLDPKTIADLDRARNNPVPWSFEWNTYGLKGRHYVLLSESNAAAVTDAVIDTPTNGSSTNE